MRRQRLISLTRYSRFLALQMRQFGLAFLSFQGPRKDDIRMHVEFRSCAFFGLDVCMPFFSMLGLGLPPRKLYFDELVSVVLSFRQTSALAIQASSRSIAKCSNFAQLPSTTANSSGGLATELQLGLLSPVYLRKLFERLGATYIKLGQSILHGVPSSRVCFSYRLLLSPVRYRDSIYSFVLPEFGLELGTIDMYLNHVLNNELHAFDFQVHGARIRDTQEDVVIKVLKPGIEDILVADLNFVYIVARILEFLSPDLSRASLVAIVKDIRESMLEEVDFKKEATNVESFRRYLEAMGLMRQATAPKVYQQYSTRRVLTMERLYGVPLTDLNSINSLVPNPETSLITALNVWFGSLLACETFHADVHAGNLWLLRDGRIGFLDFGIVGRISPKTWAAMEVFLQSLATEEYESMASSLIDMGATSTDVDSKAFARDLEKIFSSIQDLDTEIIVAAAREPNTNATAVSANLLVDERQMNALFLDVVRVSESYGLRFPREFALLMKQLLYFDRYTRLLAPNLNMLRDQRITIVSNQRSRNEYQ
ncbi:putative aarF domain-containing protein kinase, chloroplastic [Sesamum angolense]|uniref:AarF domain-containing protein kinase, chloroplastic n=1 Tax=Sesamum angolense TaxID=2727404 RepID=A0AAE1T819_9LAMI|nr:putative aarF domain-containing protein kinase, chloroplastic [Sesamum angolense]